MKITQRHKLLKARYLPWSAGISLLEVLVGSAIIATTMTMSILLFNSTNAGMQGSNLRAKTDSAIARRLEEIRHCAFFYGMNNNVKENPNEADCRLLRLDYTQELKYSDIDLDCSNMGDKFKSYLNGNSADITKSFNLQDFDNTADSMPIIVTTNAIGNQLQVSLVAESIPITVQSTIIPHAQGWCE